VFILFKLKAFHYGELLGVLFMKMRVSEVLNFVSGLFVRLMPQKVAELLAVEETRAGVLSRNEASNVLRSAFQNTEEALDFPYEVRFISTLFSFLYVGMYRGQSF
jgi:hypothetical protein